MGALPGVEKPVHEHMDKTCQQIVKGELQLLVYVEFQDGFCNGFHLHCFMVEQLNEWKNFTLAVKIPVENTSYLLAMFPVFASQLLLQRFVTSMLR